MIVLPDSMANSKQPQTSADTRISYSAGRGNSLQAFSAAALRETANSRRFPRMGAIVPSSPKNPT